VGQPELDEKLDSVELRQLKQRISLRSQLQPLDPEETRGYIHRRLLVAGADPNAPALFPAETIAAVYRHSRGIPRLINTICENALISAYARQAPSVTPDIIEEIATDFRLGVMRPSQPEPARHSDDSDAQRTAKTLLDLHEYLLRMRSGDVESPRVIGPRAVKQ
jgi:general secretion pathway protein A